MQREIIRTIQSFLSPYQIGIENKNIEIIVIDTGSENLPDLTQFKDRIKFVQFKSKHPSPVEAVNHGISIASSDLVGVLIDGARMVTPGMCRDVIHVNDVYDRAFITTLAFHLGPKIQMESVFEGYNQEVEDQILDKIDWINNGYDLYLASSLALSSINGIYGPIAESNAIFTTKKIWKELKGFDERFISIGGGLSNLDVYKRACEIDDLKHIRLSSEATFHQVHGGVATNNKQGVHDKIFNKEYESIHGKPFSVHDRIPELHGEPSPHIQYFFRKPKSVDELISENQEYIQFLKIQSELNKLLKNISKSFQFQVNDLLNSLLDSPVIIVGCRRSGSKILSQFFQKQGLFLGNNLDQRGDSEEWVEPIHSIITNERFLAKNSFDMRHVAILRDKALSILSKSNMNKKTPWGFKLPEAMLCIPELLKAFPKARIIHIVRHPVNMSLRKSDDTFRFEINIIKYVMQKGYKHLKMDFETAEKMPTYLNNAISWHFQISQLQKYIDSKLNALNYCEIKYENICQYSESTMQYICNFLGVKSDTDSLKRITINQAQLNNVDFDKHVDDIEKIWGICKKSAKKIGYTKNNYNIDLKKKTIVFVIGMHRSGTSAMTRVINLMGARVPKNLMQASSDNQSGYWESEDFVKINNQLLNLADSSWFDSNEIPVSWFRSIEVNEIKFKAIDLLKASFSDEISESMVLKDPRFCRLMPFWKDVVNELGIDFTIVNIFRHPREVFMSFKTRFDVPEFKPASIIHPEKLNLLWLRYVLEAEFNSRDDNRIFINYHDLVNYPVNTILDLDSCLKRLSKDIKSTFVEIETLTDFVSKNLQHHNNEILINQPELELSTLVYMILLHHTGFGNNLDINALDDVRIKLNQVSKYYLSLNKHAQSNIHESSPWFEEVSQSVLLNLGKINTNKKILFLSGEPASKGHSYRVIYRMEALKKASYDVEYQDLEGDFNLEILKSFSAIVLFRVTWCMRVKEIYDCCDMNGIIKIFDVDDLVFLPEIMTSENWDYLRLQSKSRQEYWQNKFVNYYKTLIKSDHVIVPTRSLAKSVSELNKPVSVIENGIGQEMLKSSNQVMQSGQQKPSEVDGFIRIGYASGSPTHQKDFEEVYEVLCQLFKEYENIKLVIVGYLELSEFPLLQIHENRIEKRPLVEHMDLFSEYYRFDINIAPLQSNNVFCEGKSQLKYHESGLVKVPTVASATQPYRDAIHNGITGYIAKNNDDWYKSLTLLINDIKLRKTMGELAQDHVIARFGPGVQSMLSSAVISDIIKSLLKKPDEAKYEVS